MSSELLDQVAVKVGLIIQSALLLFRIVKKMAKFAKKQKMRQKVEQCQPMWKNVETIPCPENVKKRSLYKKRKRKVLLW